MNKKVVTILILVTIVLVVIIITAYFFFFQKMEDIKISEQKITECLDENMEVFYKIEEKESPLADIIISVNDKSTKKELFLFNIMNIFKNYHPIELHTCGIYVIKQFNFDNKNFKILPGFSTELWRYNYAGQGEKALFFSKENTNIRDGAEVYYSYDFRIDSQEKYIVLEKSYLGKDDYSLVIKDLNTKDDVFVLSAKSIREQYSNVVGSFGFDKWTNNGRYFWGDIFEGAYVNGFFRIDTQNWKAEIFEAPQDVLGGDALNVENGYITVHPGNTWYGFADMTEEEKEKRRKQGIGTELYIHNLITNERKFVVKTDKPLWFFKPKWLSDTELQYELPTGEIKIYKNKIK